MALVILDKVHHMTGDTFKAHNGRFQCNKAFLQVPHMLLLLFTQPMYFMI